MAELTPSCFDDFLEAARQQPNPQRLLFVFAAAELPDKSTPEQQQRFALLKAEHEVTEGDVRDTLQRLRRVLAAH